ncbi:hypothetical protein F-LCD7_0207 [Faustovirus]|nr:hypothetical protein F-LCD7_0207 [Faustovirus]
MYDEHYDKTRHSERYERIEQEPKSRITTTNGRFPDYVYIDSVELPYDNHTHIFYVRKNHWSEYVEPFECTKCGRITRLPTGITDELIIDHFNQQKSQSGNTEQKPCRIAVGVDWTSENFDVIYSDCKICKLLNLE